MPEAGLERKPLEQGEEEAGRRRASMESFLRGGSVTAEQHFLDALREAGRPLNMGT